MMPFIATPRRAFIGVLVLLFAATSTLALAGPKGMKLSDAITLQNGACSLVSDATDKEQPPEPKGPQHCVFQEGPASALTTVSVPGNKDEYIVFEYTIAPNGTITGKGREGMNQAAYSCVITGQTKPGTKHGGLLKAGAVIRVWEAANAP
jgi:hypothetical protein